MSEENEVEVNPYASPRTLDSKGVAWVSSGGQSLRAVARGITLVYYGIVLALMAITLFVMAMILSNLIDSPVVFVTGGLAAAVLAVVAGVVNFVGPTPCVLSKQVRPMNNCR